MNFIKRILKYFYRKLIIFLSNFFYKKKIRTQCMGSNYGKWCFIENVNLENSTMLSCGVGEDISFDVEMIKKYNLKVIFIDPTPRAISHFQSIMDSFDQLKYSKEYSKDGKQNASSYDLSGLKKDNFFLIKKAIWSESKKILKFFYPLNKSNVSMSVSNFSNNYNQNSEHILVETISYDDVIKNFNIKFLPLIKLDIEGAEKYVLQKIIESQVQPKQILVEFDELHTYEIKQLIKYKMIHKKLTEAGYTSIVTNHFSNQLYVKNE